MVGKSNPMDQFIVQNPNYFFTRSPEHCRVNPDNLIILLHTSRTLPFKEGDPLLTKNNSSITITGITYYLRGHHESYIKRTSYHSTGNS